MQQKTAAYPVNSTEVFQASRGSTKWNSSSFDQRRERPVERLSGKKSDNIKSTVFFFTFCPSLLQYYERATD